jgi:hypothetical protein
VNAVLICWKKIPEEKGIMKNQYQCEAIRCCEVRKDEDERCQSKAITEMNNHKVCWTHLRAMSNPYREMLSFVLLSDKILLDKAL